MDRSELCLGCGVLLGHLDRDPNGDENATCARCLAEENHDFDAAPNVTFDRAGNMKTSPPPAEQPLPGEGATCLECKTPAACHAHAECLGVPAWQFPAEQASEEFECKCGLRGHFSAFSSHANCTLRPVAALSQRPVVDEAMVIRACNAYDAASNDDRPATYPWMHAALTAALAPQQPEKGEG